MEMFIEKIILYVVTTMLLFISGFAAMIGILLDNDICVLIGVVLTYVLLYVNCSIKEL